MTVLKFAAQVACAIAICMAFTQQAAGQGERELLRRMIDHWRASLRLEGLEFDATVETPAQTLDCHTVLFSKNNFRVDGSALYHPNWPTEKRLEPLIGSFSVEMTDRGMAKYRVDEFLFIESEDNIPPVEIALSPSFWYYHQRLGSLLDFANRIADDNGLYELAFSSSPDGVEVTALPIDSPDEGYIKLTFDNEDRLTGFLFYVTKLANGKPGPVMGSEYTWGSKYLESAQQWERMPEDNTRKVLRKFELHNWKLLEGKPRPHLSEMKPTLPVGTQLLRIEKGTTSTKHVGGNMGRLEHALRQNAFELRKALGYFHAD